MKSLQTDLSIYQKFNFERPPVGVRFLRRTPEGIERLDKTMALCEMITSFRHHDMTICFAAWCSKKN